MCTLARRLLSRAMKFTSSAAAGAAVFALAGTASADEVFKATKAITLPDGQNIVAFDISFVDPVLKLYILADRTNKAVDVVDTDNNKVVAQVGKGSFTGATGVNDTSGPDGVMFVGHDQIWAGDGDSTLKIFSWPGQALLGTVHTSVASDNRVDEMCNDPADHLAMVTNNAAPGDPFSTLVSTIPHSKPPLFDDSSIVKKIVFDGMTNNTQKATGGAEQCQWNPRTKRFYIALPAINGTNNGGVAVIDPKTQKVETTFVVPFNDCAAPQGMAIGPDHQILLGCNGVSGDGLFSTVVIDERVPPNPSPTTPATIIKVLNNESGADMVWFNPGDNHYFLARSSAAGPAAGGHQQLGVVDAVRLQVDQSIPTVRSAAAPLNAHSVAADPNRNQVYVPIPGANAANPNGAGTVCSSVSVPGHKGSDTQGCIAIFTTHNDDRPSVARERQPDELQE